MPKLHYTEKLTEAITMGVQVGAGTQDIENKGVYTVRLKYDGQKKALVKSTGVKYEGGSPRQKADAITQAHKLYAEYFQASQATDDLAKPSDITLLTMRFLREAERLADENERRAIPIHEVDGGRGYWDRGKVKSVTAICNNYLMSTSKNDFNGFWKYITPKTKRVTGRYSKELLIHNIAEQDLDLISEFMWKRKPDLSPSQILKVITLIRHIYRYAYNERIIKTIPTIRRPKRQTKERIRREITEEEFLKMVRYTRNSYIKPIRQSNIKYVEYEYTSEYTPLVNDYNTGKLSPIVISYRGENRYKTERIGNNLQSKSIDFDLYRDYRYLFHLWLMILSYSGIRPPTGGTEHTMPRWSHYHEKESGAILQRLDEKNHTYDAAILPEGVEYFRALRKFQEERGIYRPDGYLFAHPMGAQRSKGAWERGDPIISFRKQWIKMLEELGLDSDSSLQRDRITPSALRSYYITMRLRHGKVDIHKLAKATGTSTEVVMMHYNKFSTEAELPELTKGGYYGEDKKGRYDPDTGYYTGRE